MAVKAITCARQSFTTGINKCDYIAYHLFLIKGDLTLSRNF